MTRKPDILDREEIFSGRKVALEVHHIRDAGGRETTREVVRHPGSVAILAFPEPGVLLLESIWRYAAERTLLEIPAGTLDPDEKGAACAARELAEETGYRAGSLEPLITIHTSPGILTEQLTLFLATDLEEGEPRREAGEQIENVLVPFDEAMAMVADGRITDGKTVLAILFWNAREHEAPGAGKGNA
ncbi:MAG TPA: NUDIX hydrolase [Phycisphaerae bacterium]|nr:NUDIX hydrolase [Phycisphaerae bacterium]